MDIALVANELKNDPESVGYKNADGSFKSLRELTALLMNKPMVDNPDPAPQVPIPISATTLLGMLSAESLAKIEYVALVAVREACDANDRSRLGLQLQIFQIKGWITGDEYTALNAELQKTEADPNWPTTVPGPSRLETVTGETSITELDLQQAVNLAKM